MSSSELLPTADNDYAATDAPLNKAFWDAALTSVGSRIRALEAVKADWEALIAEGTGQALAVIQANVEPQLVALTAIIDQLKADVAAAEDAIAVIVSGGVTMDNVVGLTAALNLKANVSYVDAAIDALKGGAPAAYDTLVEIAAKLADDDTAITGLLTAISAKADKATQIRVGKGLSVDGAAGSEAAPALGDLSVSRTLRLTVLPETKASKRNRHLNPAFQVCQDRAIGATLAVSTAWPYVFDGVQACAVGGGVLTCSQVLKTTPGGSPNRFKATVTNADAMLATADFYGVRFCIEGAEVADLMFGTASARPFTWRGVVNLPAGTYGLGFMNGAGDRAYVVPFTVALAEANTDKLITATVPGDTSGTWIKDASGIGLQVAICFASGVTFQTANAGVWQTGNYWTTPAQTNNVAVANSAFEIADIGLYAGAELPEWEKQSYPDDLKACQRCFATGAGALAGSSVASGIWHKCPIPLPVQMRASPAVSTVSPGTSGPIGSLQFQSGTTALQFVGLSTGSGGFDMYATYIANARL